MLRLSILQTQHCSVQFKADACILGMPEMLASLYTILHDSNIFTSLYSLKIENLSIIAAKFLTFRLFHLADII